MFIYYVFIVIYFFFQELLDSCGVTEIVPERCMDAVTGKIFGKNFLKTIKQF